MFYRVLIVFLLMAQGAMADIDVENNFSEKFMLGGYIDAGFSELGYYNAVPSREFSIRRSGFELNAEFAETLKAELKVEVRPDDIFLKNAFIRWDPAPWSRARAGQFKRETLLGGNLSFWNLNMLDRPLVYDLCENLTYAGRDLGFDLRIDLPSFSGVELRGTAGVFNGDERAEERTDNELLYTFRGEIKIPSIDLTLGASAASHRQGEENSIEPSGYAVSARQNAFSADISLDFEISNWYDVSFASEMSTGDNWKNVDVLAGETAPEFLGYWGTFTAFYHPWNVQGIKTISFTASYDKLTANTDLDNEHSRMSIIGAVYPSDNLRLRFGGILNRISSIQSGIFTEDKYTDFIAEVGLRF
ncbi:MAG: hypothetical protein K8S62_08510 [Candidatus Sabulitectum sp.]|nr:hypothetical protein [Candidatus Sabulitectum sp.]